MKLRNDKSGQVMLTSAFILAIILTFIALVLNNVIYFNNISYVGFMDQSGHDDISIKDIVAEEAIYAYNLTKGNQADFDGYMEDLIHSLNTVAIPHGYHISFTRVSNNEPWQPTSTYKSTRSLLNIYSEDSNKTYTIDTYYTPPTPPTPPGPGPSPLDCIVSMSSNKSQMIANGSDMAIIQVHVTDTSGSLPLAGITVNLSATRGGFYFVNGSDGHRVITDSLGNARSYYIPSATGVDLLNASVGLNPHRPGNLSSNITITNQAPGGTCSHTVTINDATTWTDHQGNNYYVYIKVPITVPATNPAYNFSTFTAQATLNNSASNNVQYLSYSDMGGFTVPGYVQGPTGTPYTTNIVMRFGWTKNTAYRAVFTVTVDAYCNLDHKPLPTTARTFTVTGS